MPSNNKTSLLVSSQVPAFVRDQHELFVQFMEYYYKYMWDVIAYDIDNVKIRYLGNNKTKAYATGIGEGGFGISKRPLRQLPRFDEAKATDRKSVV